MPNIGASGVAQYQAQMRDRDGSDEEMLREDATGEDDRAESGFTASTAPLLPDEAEGAEDDAATYVTLEGPGVLILLPDGRITGSVFTGAPRAGLRGDSISGGRRQLGIHGRAVLQARDCTRDDEWHLLLVTITDFVAGAREVKARDLCRHRDI